MVVDQCLIWLNLRALKARVWLREVSPRAVMEFMVVNSVGREVRLRLEIGFKRVVEDNKF